jgi:hypothetical protein
LVSISRGKLYAILSNPIYIGRIRHRDATYDGLHPAIVDQSLWEQVQARLADNRQGERHLRAVVHPSILAGKLFDGNGQKMIASHASKGAHRYRYYVSQDRQHGGDAADNGMRIPAPEIEALVCENLQKLFDDPVGLIEQIAGPTAASGSVMPALSAARTIAEALRGSDTAAVAHLFEAIVQRIDVAEDSIVVAACR